MPTEPAPTTALLEELTEPRRQGPYAPRDDCARQPGAAAFRHALAEAVARGDAEAVAALASSDIRLGFAGDDGRERFLENLKAPDNGLMTELKRLLPLGCATDEQGNLTMPWHFAQDMGDIDAYSAAIVTGEDVPLHTVADGNSPVNQRLSWEVVELASGLYPGLSFQEVKTRGGAQGYVPTDDLRVLLDYRLLASREDGEWKITALVAAD